MATKRTKTESNPPAVAAIISEEDSPDGENLGQLVTDPRAVEIGDKTVLLRNLTTSFYALAHPQPRADNPIRTIIVPASGVYVFDFEESETRLWLKSRGVRQAIKAGKIEVRLVDDPAELEKPLEIPQDLRIDDAYDLMTVDNIIFNKDSARVLEIVNLRPIRRADGKVDVHYLKESHVPILKLALYKEQHGRNRTWLVNAIQQRLDYIGRM